MKILVTGFEPFGGERVNPALEVVSGLPATIGGATVVTAAIPVVFGQSAQVLEDLLVWHRPDVVVCIGQAGGRSDLTLERVAINVNDAPIADNAGQQPIDEPIRADGQTAYFSTLPIKTMVAAIRQAGLPASVSNTAGTYVCNHLMYQVLYLADKSFPGLRAGFIHVPYLPSQVLDKPGTPSMSLSDISRGLEVALESLVSDFDLADVKVNSGAVH